MFKPERRSPRRVAYLIAGGVLMLIIGTTGSSEAQGPAPAPAQGQPPGRGRGIPLPRQGFEATGQNPANYTPQEAAAVALMLKWIETTNSHDTPAHMALIDTNIAFRGDPVRPIQRGARGYCAQFGFVGSAAWFGLNELYVVGGPSDTLVLMNRTDINSPFNGAGLGGYPVPLAAMLRVQNGKIVEWYDMPTNKVSVGARPGPQGTAERVVPPRCQPYPVGGVGAAAAAAPSGTTTLAPARTYGTNKPEFWFNPFEASAAQAVRALFAARQAGNPLLLGAFVHENVGFRGDPDSDLVRGRDNLLKNVCGYIGGRLELTELFVVGGDYDTAVITRWNAYDVAGNRTQVGSFFRVQNGLIVEWMDTVVNGTSPATRANPNAPACQAVNAALASRTGTAPQNQ
jgi:hypothetical protein